MRQQQRHRQLHHPQRLRFFMSVFNKGKQPKQPKLRPGTRLPCRVWACEQKSTVAFAALISRNTTCTPHNLNLGMIFDWHCPPPVFGLLCTLNLASLSLHSRLRSSAKNKNKSWAFAVTVLSSRDLPEDTTHTRLCCLFVSFVLVLCATTMCG